VDKKERQRRLAWDVAMSCAQKTGESSVDIYQRLLTKFDEVDAYGHMVLDESKESK
jgi:hypothetical protein